MSKPSVEEQCAALATQFGHLLVVVDALREAMIAQQAALTGHQETIDILLKRARGAEYGAPNVN
ncbi:MAG TPA: hypothetical protein DEQ47_15620 [Solibacterales bacterium]|nr:hypothetical protein [Bryobacterales bacterium]